MKELVFLPDRDGRDEIGDAAGFVRIGATGGELAELAERLAVPAGRAEAEVRADDLAWRSALTLALLTDVWAEEETKLTSMSIDEYTTLFASWVLGSRPEKERGEPVHLLLLECGGEKRLLGIADAQTGLRLPAQQGSLVGAIPRHAVWIDAWTGEAADPVPMLCERERDILLARMQALGITQPEAIAFAADLRNADAAEREAVRREEHEALERLAVRLEAVCGLTDFEALTVHEERYAAGDNALLRCLGREDPIGGETFTGRTWLWKGVPFAGECRETGLTGVSHPDSLSILEEIRDEVTIMSGSSVRWNANTARAMQAWLDEQQRNAALLPQARARAEASCALLSENGRQVQSVVTLTWPWDAASGAMRALLTEALGEGWLEAAANPFSDRLTKLTGHALGDTALATCCACADGVLLPPLSREMAACAAKNGVQGGLALDAMRFQPQEDGGITASFLLRADGEIRMARSYAPSEIEVLTEAESPCVAVWPCLPMPGWKAYYVFVRGGTEVAAYDDGEWRSTAPATDLDALLPGMTHSGAWRSLRTATYPGCLTIRRDGICLGALPNMLPEYTPERRGDVVVGIDLGSSTTTTAYAWDGVPTLMEGQALTRLLTAPQEMAEDGFLGSLTPASVIPTSAVLTGRGSELFTDGYAFRPESFGALAAFDPASLRARLKWRSDRDSVRARRILLHQVMQGAALTAASAGAASIAWRLTIADDMGDEGREAVLDMMRELAQEVCAESGLPVTAGLPAVSWAEESAALSACLRAEGSGRGACVSADLGSGSTKLHLWLLNQGKPAIGAVAFQGVQDMLLRFYRRQPVRLLEDLGDCGDEKLLQDVLAFVDQLNPDLDSARQQDKLCLMLDMFMDTHRSTLIRHLSARAAANQPTWMQSLLLETEAAVLFCVGLMLAQAGDNPLISHAMPEDMTVCLTGRGAWLLETIPATGRNALQRLAHSPLRIDHAVRFVTIRAAAQPVQSVALGLTVTRETERLADAPPIRTRESFSQLMQRFVQQLCSAFPAQAWRLHEGIFDWQSGQLTPAGMDSVRRAAAASYDAEEELTACVLTFVHTLRKSPILTDDMIEPGA